MRKEIVMETAQNEMKNTSVAPALQLNDIVKVYGGAGNEVTALKGVNLSFRKNEFVSILGPSGCGKTTLLNIIGGLDRYTSGDLIIEGRSTKNYSDKDWNAYRNNCIGFVFQSYNLIPHQTVLANVELSLELSGISKKERHERSVKMLEKVGLTEQMHKKPNQLSGGQMQRVAIARALINNPEIILADEPTGALDTETSIQVMDLLKEVAGDKLVIMVTHNPELAQKYSTRIINLLDGEMIGDSNPFESQVKPQPKTMRKPKMGFKTAFALSIRNLFSKKARTILTSIAGSIGIIGVALVLALSNGFSSYMSRMQTDTLASFPLTIKESSVDLSSFNQVYEGKIRKKFQALDNVYVQQGFERLTGMLKNNNLSDDRVMSAIDSIDKNDVYAIQKGYGIDMNDYFYTDISIKLNENDSNPPLFMSIDQLVGAIESEYDDKLYNATELNTSFVRQYIPTIQELPDSSELLNQQYDILYKTKDDVCFENLTKEQIVLVVDEYNSVSDISLALLGLNDLVLPTDVSDSKDIQFSKKQDDTLSIKEITSKKFYVALNDQIYKKSTTDNTWLPNMLTSQTEGLLALDVVGIVRAKQNVKGILTEGFAYSPKLTEYVLKKNSQSKIVKDGLPNEEFKLKSLNIFNLLSGENPLVDVPKVSPRSLCAVTTPSTINIYPKNFEAKERVKAHIDNYNKTQQDNEDLQITYSDMMSLVFTALTTMVDSVTYVLIAFTSISLIVSSVMIGIITYISVVERTKEIGVLRALGASKNEISNVFNAETFLIGLFSGGLGVLIAFLLTIPINVVIGNLVAEVGKIAVLSPITALILVAISIGLTLVAGLIPSRIASKKDPVVALRSE